MGDYESTAFDLVEQMKSKHEDENNDMLQYITEKFYNDHRWSKQIIDMRK
jgi:hypothetical protein